MKESTLSQWVHRALAGGAKRRLIITQDDRYGYLAILDFTDLDLRLGAPSNTPDHAFVLLDAELEEKRDLWCYSKG